MEHCAAIILLQDILPQLLEHLVYSDGEAKASCQSDRRYQDPLYAYREYEGRYRNATDV